MDLDQIPEPVAAEVWSRREAGESRIGVAMWLARAGYLVTPDEADVIASRYANQLDASRSARAVAGPAAPREPAENTQERQDAAMSDVSAAQRDALYGWLAQLKSLATQGDLPSRAMLADTEMVRLLDALQALLREHEPNNEGRCPSCPSRAQRRGYRCAVWATAHKHLIAAAPTDPDAHGGRHALAQGRGLASW